MIKDLDAMRTRFDKVFDYYSNQKSNQIYNLREEFWLIWVACEAQFVPVSMPNWNHNKPLFARKDKE